MPYGPEVDSHLIAQFNPETFNELVDIIYDVLCQVELARFPKGFAMGQEGSDGETDWQHFKRTSLCNFTISPFFKRSLNTISFSTTGASR